MQVYKLLKCGPWIANINDYMLCYLVLLAKDQATVRIPYINYDYTVFLFAHPFTQRP